MTWASFLLQRMQYVVCRRKLKNIYCQLVTSTVLLWSLFLRKCTVIDLIRPDRCSPLRPSSRAHVQVAYCANKLWCHWQQQPLQKAELPGTFLHVVLLADLVLLVNSCPGVWGSQVRWNCGWAVPERHTLSEVGTPCQRSTHHSLPKWSLNLRELGLPFFFFNLKYFINFLEDKPAGFSLPHKSIHARDHVAICSSTVLFPSL